MLNQIRLLRIFSFGKFALGGSKINSLLHPKELCIQRLTDIKSNSSLEKFRFWEVCLRRIQG